LNMARKPSAAPFKLKYTNGKKTDTSAFFQMANPNQPAPSNPAVDDAINKKMDEVITKKVDESMGRPGDSPVLEKGEKWKKLKEVGKKVLSGAATALTHGLDAVYGTGKIAADPNIFSSAGKVEKDPKTKTPEEKVEELKKV
jgi:hypothetical protein